jgi:site-specific DNA-methyltransferase (cytosine-N4-specific)
MPEKMVEFFIKFLTQRNALILDPFGGSNTTGRVAENLNRRWIYVEKNEEYVIGSKGRFRN